MTLIDDVIQFLSKFEQSVRIHFVGMTSFFDVKGIHGDSVLGGNASEGDVEALTVNMAGQAIEEAGFVGGLNLNYGTLEGELVINVDAQGERRGQEI